MEALSERFVASFEVFVYVVKVNKLFFCVKIFRIENVYSVIQYLGRKLKNGFSSLFYPREYEARNFISLHCAFVKRMTSATCIALLYKNHISIYNTKTNFFMFVAKFDNIKVKCYYLGFSL